DQAGAVTDLDGGERHHQRAIHLAGGHLDAREGAGLQRAVGVGHVRLDAEGARLQVDVWADAGHAPLDRRVWKRLGAQRDQLAEADAGGELLWDFTRRPTTSEWRE